jgi:uncharacterized protein with ATP-grasp and redox domains
MKNIPDCVPDALQLVIDTAKLVSDDAFIHRKVLSKVLGEISEDPDFGNSPLEFTFRCLKSAYRALGVKDPYETEKARSNKAMLGLEKGFRQYLDVAPDRLGACINLVLASSIDVDVLGRAEAERDILERLGNPLALDDRETLLKSLTRAESVMYILDNAGEIVMDKLLIEEIGRKCRVTAVVAAKPLLNLATREDAEAVKLDEVAEVADPGAPMLGLTLEMASSSFREAFAEADVVIVKGEYNYEALCGTEREVFFMLTAYCANLARKLGVPTGAGALVHHPGVKKPVAVEVGSEKKRT